MGRGKLEFKGREVGIDLCARVGRFGPKSENQAAGARFSRTNHGGPLDWVEGTYLGRGELRFKGWEGGIDPCARVGVFGPKSENRAAEAQFSRTQRGGPLNWVEGTYLGRGEPRFKGWEVGINRRARVEGFGGKPKNRAAEVLFWLMQCRGW